MKRAYTYRTLMERLDDYVQDPHNHEGCSFKNLRKFSGEDFSAYSKNCDCGLYSHVDQFLTWVRDSDLVTGDLVPGDLINEEEK